MPSIQEFDLEFKPAKIVRGHGLCQLVLESKDKDLFDDLG